MSTRTRSMFPILLISAGAFVLACGGAPDAESPVSRESEPPASEGGGAAETPTADRGAGVEERRKQLALRRLPFWHDPELVSLLGLSEAQLSVMETRRQAQLEERRKARLATTEERGELAGALENGDWAVARQISQRLGVMAVEGLDADTELKISILETLSAEQRQLLARERPNALRRSWLLPGGRRQARSNPLLDGRGQ